MLFRGYAIAILDGRLIHRICNEKIYRLYMIYVDGSFLGAVLHYTLCKFSCYSALGPGLKHPVNDAGLLGKSTGVDTRLYYDGYAARPGRNG